MMLVRNPLPAPFRGCLCRRAVGFLQTADYVAMFHQDLDVACSICRVQPADLGELTTAVGIGSISLFQDYPT